MRVANYEYFQVQFYNSCAQAVEEKNPLETKATHSVNTAQYKKHSKSIPLQTQMFVMRTKLLHVGNALFNGNNKNDPLRYSSVSLKVQLFDKVSIYWSNFSFNHK